MTQRVVILGTGGTIAGTAATSADNVGYTSAQLGVQALVEAVPPLAALSLECEQVAQLDSKDMSHAVWQRLAQRIAEHLARDEVAGVVVTHGTDTLEETAYFLHRVLAPVKPVVLTAAMRPATSLQRDGPQNLLDAVTVVLAPEARGVVVAIAGAVHGPLDVAKRHGYRLDAFDSGDAGPTALVREGGVEAMRDWPHGVALGLAHIAADVTRWPAVEIVTSHAGASGLAVDALVAQGVRGLVVAGTGNGTVHAALEAALADAQAAGVKVLRASRCAGGVVGSAPSTFASAGVLTPAKARVELLLQLLGADTMRTAPSPAGGRGRQHRQS
jgi:L-asparaginase